MTITTCVFDAYGTLFDVASAARRLSEQSGNADFKRHWPQISEIWRQKQLQYSWLRTIMGNYIDFWTLTKNGLDFALEKYGLAHDLALREDLLALYWELSPYKDAPMCLAKLKARGKSTAILSNGSKDMLDGAVSSSGVGEFLDAVLSVEDVKIFKPDPRVYQMVLDRFQCNADQVLFVTSNGWDAAGAAAFGFKTAWVNRADEPVDKLPATPGHILTTLADIPPLLEA